MIQIETSSAYLKCSRTVQYIDTEIKFTTLYPAILVITFKDVVPAFLRIGGVDLIDAFCYTECIYSIPDGEHRTLIGNQTQYTIDVREGLEVHIKV